MSSAQALSLVTYVQPWQPATATLAPMVSYNPRATLTANMRKLVGDESVRAWALARGLNVRMIERITEGDHNTTLEKIDEIAQACGVPAWQLLLPDFEPGVVIDAPITAADRELLAKLKRLIT